MTRLLKATNVWKQTALETCIVFGTTAEVKMVYQLGALKPAPHATTMACMYGSEATVELHVEGAERTGVVEAQQGRQGGKPFAAETIIACALHNTPAAIEAVVERVAGDDGDAAAVIANFPRAAARHANLERDVPRGALVGGPRGDVHRPRPEVGGVASLDVDVS